MMKKILGACILLLCSSARPARADWSNEITTHKWDYTNFNSYGGTDCPPDYVDGDLTPGRPAGGWFEWRFMPTNGPSWSKLANPNTFLTLYGADPTRKCPRTLNEYTTGHLHGVMNARLALYGGTMYSVYDTVSGYYWQNKIKLQQDPSSSGVNQTGSMMVYEFARNPRHYIDTRPGSANYPGRFDVDPSYLTNFVLGASDGCDHSGTNGTALGDARTGTYSYNGQTWTYDANWRNHAGIDQEATMCAPPGMIQTLDPDIDIREDAGTTPAGFAVWTERYVEMSSPSAPDGFDPAHQRSADATIWPYRRLAVHVDSFVPSTLPGGTPSTFARAALTPDDEVGLHTGLALGVDAISPRVAALAEGTSYGAGVAWAEASMMFNDGNYYNETKLGLYPSAYLNLYYRHYSAASASWDPVVSIADEVGKPYICNAQEVSSGRATGRKTSWTGTHDIGVIKNGSGVEEPIIAAMFHNGATPGTLCELRVIRRDATTGHWVFMGSPATIASNSPGTGPVWPRLTVYKNIPFLVFATTQGGVYVVSWNSATSTWDHVETSWSNANMSINKLWNTPYWTYGSYFVNPIMAKGPSITVTSASPVSYAAPSGDTTINVRVAFHQNEFNYNFWGSVPDTPGQGVWGVGVTTCTAKRNGGSYQCLSDPYVDGRHRQNTSSQIADYLDVYQHHPSSRYAANFGISWGSRVAAVPSTLSASSSWGAVTPVSQHYLWSMDINNKNGQVINGQPGTTDLISNGIAGTPDGQPDAAYLAWTGTAGDHREYDRGVFAKANLPVSRDVIGTGWGFTIALSNSSARGNEVYTWGQNDNGELGIGSWASGQRLAAPQRIVADNPSDPVVKVAAGSYNGGYLTKSGRLYLWGANYYGAVCNGSFSTSTTPVTIPTQTAPSPGDVITDFAIGSFHTIVARSDGTVWSCGFNGSGQLGNAQTTNSATWVQVTTSATAGTGPYLTGAVSVSAGGYHSCVSTLTGIYCFGDNTYGQLGVNNDTTSYAYARVVPLPARPAYSMALGSYHTAVIMENGGPKYYAWGYNKEGNLGLSTMTTAAPYGVLTPSWLNMGINYGTRLFATRYNTFMLDPTVGKLYAVGRDSVGQLGNDAAVSPNTNVWTLAANPDWIDTVGSGPGAEHAYAVASVGKTRTNEHWTCWGMNSMNQCGDGTTMSNGVGVASFRPSSFGCASGVSQFQVFRLDNSNADIYGCAGHVDYPSAQTLCGPNSALSSATLWNSYRGNTANTVVNPKHHYWTATDLWYAGSSTSCGPRVGRHRHPRRDVLHLLSMWRHDADACLYERHQ